MSELMKKKLFTVFCYQCKRVQVDIQVYIQHTQFDEYFESKQAQPSIHQPRTVIARKRIKHEIMPERQKDGIYVCTYSLFKGRVNPFIFWFKF